MRGVLLLIFVSIGTPASACNPAIYSIAPRSAPRSRDYVLYSNAYLERRRNSNAREDLLVEQGGLTTRRVLACLLSGAVRKGETHMCFRESRFAFQGQVGKN